MSIHLRLLLALVLVATLVFLSGVVLALLSPALMVVGLCMASGATIASISIALVLWRRLLGQYKHFELLQGQNNALLAKQESILTHVDTNQIHQIELAGQIIASIRQTAGISKELLFVTSGMEGFDTDFASGNDSVNQIRASIGDLDSAVILAASAISETAAAVEEISASIVKVSEESSNRYEEVKDLVDVSRQGQDEMTVTLDVIREVTGGIDDLQGFISVINDIAKQTSLLAMNAAIEAAHAGQSGKGFAVVADEVRKLAESSAANASSIANRLQSLIEGIRRAEDATRHTSELFTTLETKVQRASNSFLEIRQGTEELALGGQEILKAVAHMKDTSNTIKDGSAGIVMASNDLHNRVGHLKEQSGTLLERIRHAREQAGNVNRSFLATAQSDIAQMRSGDKISLVLLENHQSEAQEQSNLASILMLQHMAWVARIRAVIDGSLEMKVDEVADHHICDLGKWIESQAKGTFPSLEQAHASLHHNARGAVENKLANRIEAAEANFSQMLSDSEQVITQLKTVFASSDLTHAEFMPWKAEYELKHPIIDQQHRRLVDLINQLHASIRDGQSRQLMDGILDELVNYTQTHFKDEEGLFTASSYPGKKGHMEQHVAFIQQISDTIKAYRSGSSVLSTETLVFLKDWLLKHILGTDRGYRQYLK